MSLDVNEYLDSFEKGIALTQLQRHAPRQRFIDEWYRYIAGAVNARELQRFEDGLNTFLETHPDIDYDTLLNSLQRLTCRAAPSFLEVLWRHFMGAATAARSGCYCAH